MSGIIKRTWVKCTDNDIIYLYEGVWEYIAERYGYTNKPQLYMNKSNSIRQLGLFSYDGKGNTTITLNQLFYKHKDSVLNTIVHEFAHYIAYQRYGRNCGHSARWHLIANDLGNHFGENITTSCSHNHEVLQEARELKPQVSRRKQHYYQVICERCGHIFTYKKQRWWFKDKWHVDDIKCNCPYCHGHTFSIEKRNLT